jgi:hypothetical protein
MQRAAKSLRYFIANLLRFSCVATEPKFATSIPKSKTRLRFSSVAANRRYPSVPLAHIVIVGFAKKSIDGM